MLEKPVGSGMHPEGQAREGTRETGTSRLFALTSLALAIVAVGSLFLFFRHPSGYGALVLGALAVTLGIGGLSQSRPEPRGRPIAIAALLLGVAALGLVSFAAGSFISPGWADPTSIVLAGIGVALGTLDHVRHRSSGRSSRWMVAMLLGAAVLIALWLADLLRAWTPLLLGLAAIVLGIRGLWSRGARGIAVLALVLGLLLVAYLVYFWIAYANCC